MAKEREYFISEKNFSFLMENTVEPYLKERLSDGYFTADDGQKLHYAYYKADAPKGNIAICHGFTESAEKFREMCWYFLHMNLNVFAIDNRGHGLSYRINDKPEVVHIDNFDRYIEDLNIFAKKVIKSEAPSLPMYLYSHSMGGGISVQYMQKYPDTFEKVILSAPMIKAKTAGIPEGIAKFVTRLFILLGKEQEKVIGYKGFNPNRTYEDSHDTSKARFDYYQKKRIENVHLQTAAPSYRWVSEAIRISRLNLDAKRNEKITAKVLLCQPEEDSTVYSEMEDEFIKLVKNGKLVKFTKCKHEIYNSVDETVIEYLDVIESFLFKE